MTPNFSGGGFFITPLKLTHIFKIPFWWLKQMMYQIKTYDYFLHKWVLPRNTRTYVLRYNDSNLTKVRKSTVSSLNNVSPWCRSDPRSLSPLRSDKGTQVQELDMTKRTLVHCGLTYERMSKNLDGLTSLCQIKQKDLRPYVRLPWTCVLWYTSI